MNDNGTLASLKSCAKAVNLDLRGEISILASPAQLAQVPNSLHPAVYGALRIALPAGLYSHQARAISAYIDGRDVCLATPTASGKSIVFMTAAAHRARSTPGAKTLALYPAKALIQDQLDKWRSFLAPIDLSVTFIDGSVPAADRPNLLDQNAVVLMTPDVAHAWLMSHLDHPSVRKFATVLRLLVLDEAHVYDGVFGTNMAYFLRRLQTVSGLRRVIVSTATIGHPAVFLEKLVGRKFEVLSAEDDGAGSPGKTILALRTNNATFEQYVQLIHRMARLETGRFLAFADSRKMVEQIVASVNRVGEPAAEEEFNERDDEVDDTIDPQNQGATLVLPYRAGYEEDDRLQIQRSLNRGTLAGVVSTSALELGLDIGELSTVILLGIPPSINAFWQRLGRAGRQKPGYCLLLDDVGIVSATQSTLQAYINRPRETGWLYLENRYIQYANALCAAVEISVCGTSEEKLATFDSLPAQFVRLLKNELDPTEGIPEDLYPLKQRGQGGPHLEFPIRTGVEKSLAIRLTQGPNNIPLGSVTFSQSLREAYPGAVYYYMARPYRIFRYRLRDGEIFARRCNAYTTTQPLLQNMVFPKFPVGVFQLRSGDTGFYCESELQVSERINGFVERQGGAKAEKLYGPESLYYQRPLIRYFETTGICWQFDDRAVTTESIAVAVLEAACSKFGIQSRDLGVGVFSAKTGPAGGGKCQGICIYDAANGSLRLTQQVFDNFSLVLEEAIRAATTKDEQRVDILGSLETLFELESATTEALPNGHAVVANEDNWISIVAPGTKAYRRGEDGEVNEVIVKGWRYTPMGLMYELESNRPDVAVRISAAYIVPHPSESTLIQVNLITGEERTPG